MIKQRFFSIGILLFPLAGFAQATVVPMGTDANDPNNASDTEPSIAVNPTNPSDIVVVAFSDNWGPGANASIWRSSNGGTNWTKSLILPQPGNNLTGPHDQKITFDRLGNLFVAELGTFPSTDFVYRQTGTAAAALTVGASFGDDQPHIAVDRSVSGVCSGRVYAPWLNTTSVNYQSNVTNSANGGTTVTNVPVGNNANFSNRTTRVALGPDGSVYVIYKTREGPTAGMFENAHFRVDRSDDCGTNWGANGAGGVSVHGTTAVQTVFTLQFGDPAKGKVNRARSSDAWIAASQGTGDIYAAYVSLDASGFAQIYAARSKDRGVTWTTARVSNGANHSVMPEIAVTDNGTVGVLYLDYDNSGATTVFRHHFARSFDNGLTWSDQVLQAVDPSTIANAADGFLFGDYEGLTSHGTRFYGVFTGQGSARTTVQMDPVFFTVTGLRSFVSICITHPKACQFPLLKKNLVILNCTRLPCLFRDPIPRNCIAKFACPGCPSGGLCPPYYTFILEYVDPAWRVEVYDPRGLPVLYQQRQTGTTTEISFRPAAEYFKNGKIGEYFFTFENSDRRMAAKSQSIRMSLRSGNEAFGGEVGGKRPH